MLADVFQQLMNSTLNGVSVVIKNTFVVVERSEPAKCRFRARSAPAAVQYTERNAAQAQKRDSPSNHLDERNQNRSGRRLRSYTTSACASAAAVASVLKPVCPEASVVESDLPGSVQKTTLILRNLPQDYTRAKLLETLTLRGFLTSIDFLYLPMNFGTLTSFGHAFINCTSHDEAKRFMNEFQGFYDWIQPCTVSRAAAHVEWSLERQGLEGQIERYRNSAMMHANVVDEAKPILLHNGCRIAFPQPTQAVKPLRVRAWKIHQARCRIESETSSTQETESSSPSRFRLGDPSSGD